MLMRGWPGPVGRPWLRRCVDLPASNQRAAVKMVANYSWFLLGINRHGCSRASECWSGSPHAGADSSEVNLTVPAWIPGTLLIDENLLMITPDSEWQFLIASLDSRSRGRMLARHRPSHEL